MNPIYQFKGRCHKHTRVIENNVSSKLFMILTTLPIKSNTYEKSIVASLYATNQKLHLKKKYFIESQYFKGYLALAYDNLNSKMELMLTR